MFHCNSRPGAWVIGQGGGASAEGITFDAEHNVLAAMVRWVEDGIAPETIGGTKFVDDDVKKGADYMRRHCRYPQRSTTLASSWECLEGTSA
jgi:feruloyl esterase